LNDCADFSDQRRHENPAFLVVAAVGVIDGAQLFHQEGDVTTFAEYGGDNPRQGNHPLEMFHRLGVDEDFVGAANLVVRVLVQNDVVDGDVERMLRNRRLDLIGGT